MAELTTCGVPGPLVAEVGEGEDPHVDRPDTRYAVTDDGVHIAYQVVGTGSVDVVFVHAFASHVEGSSIARPLIEGQRNETIVRDDTAAQLFPSIDPIDFDEAVTRTRFEPDAA